MASPPEPGGPSGPGEPRPPGAAEEALRRLEQRLDRASEAAERLMAQAAEAAASSLVGAGDPGGAGHPGDGGHPSPGDLGGAESAKPPPRGWQVPDEPSASQASDLEPFLALVHALRDLIPPELQRRLIAALRELLLALRALIDWYLERLERRREDTVEVQDIPIL